MPSTERSHHFIYSTPALSVLFFSIIACSVLMALVFYYSDMLQKVTMQRTQQFSAFVCYRKNPHAQLLGKLRPIALAQTCRFLAIQSLEFQEIWQKKDQRPRKRSITKNLNFERKRLTANYGNLLCQNSIRTVLTKGFNVNSQCAKDENNLTTGFF